MSQPPLGTRLPTPRPWLAEGRYPTVPELVTWLRSATVEEVTRHAGAYLEFAPQASRCWEMQHEDELGALRARADRTAQVVTAAEAVVRTQGHAACQAAIAELRHALQVLHLAEAGPALHALPRDERVRQ